jgi:hypothetical protein
MSILWEVIVSMIMGKNVHVNMYPVVSGYGDIAV